MTFRALIPLAAVLASAASFAQQTPAAPGRTVIEQTYPEGKVKVTFGAPRWQDAFAEQMKDGLVWRLGASDPASAQLECGIATAKGVVFPGDYKLAMKYVKDGSWSLLVYEGAGFHNDAAPTWEIPSSQFSKTEPTVEKLALSFDESKALLVRFGPYLAGFKLTPAKLNPTAETKFADIPVRVTTVAMPLGEAMPKNAHVGRVEVERRGVKLTYDMYLTMEGETAKLAFKNGRQATLEKEREQVTAALKRIKDRQAQADEAVKERLAAAVARQEKRLAEIDEEIKQASRLVADKTVETKTVKREQATQTLQFGWDRPEGAMTFKFGAHDRDAEFTVVPREFLAPRRDG